MKKSKKENKANSVNGTLSAECGESVALGSLPIDQVGVGRHPATGPDGDGSQVTTAPNTTGTINPTQQDGREEPPTTSTEQRTQIEGKSGNYARIRESNKRNFNDIFKQTAYIKFFSIMPIGEGNLTKLNMFKVDKAINNQIGLCQKISEDYRTKSWTVEVKSKEQGNKLQKMSHLLSEPVTVVPHETHNQSQGVLTCTLLKGYTDDDITEGLSEHGVIKCRRIIRGMKSTSPEPTSTLILTFNTSSPPDRIHIRTGLIERIRPYIPLPKRCFNCQRYGHSGAKCRKPVAVCLRCGLDMEDGHSYENCNRPVNCLHCKEPHSVTSRSCPKYLLEKEILTLKTKEHLSYPEARAKISEQFPAGTRLYSTIVKTNNHHIPENQAIDINNNRPNTLPPRKPQIATSSNKRHQSQSPEKPRTKEKRSEPINSVSYNITSHDNIETIEITRPPETSPTRRRNSLPDVRTSSQHENKILNNIRKTTKKKTEHYKPYSTNR